DLTFQVGNRLIHDTGHAFFPDVSYSESKNIILLDVFPLTHIKVSHAYQHNIYRLHLNSGLMKIHKTLMPHAACHSKRHAMYIPGYMCLTVVETPMRIITYDTKIFEMRTDSRYRTD